MMRHGYLCLHVVWTSTVFGITCKKRVLLTFFLNDIKYSENVRFNIYKYVSENIRLSKIFTQNNVLPINCQYLLQLPKILGKIAEKTFRQYSWTVSVISFSQYPINKPGEPFYM